MALIRLDNLPNRAVTRQSIIDKSAEF